jgi:hypothetical protein
VATTYQLVIRCVAGIGLTQPFRRVVELSSMATLADLHALIQELSGCIRSGVGMAHASISSAESLTPA